MRSCSGRRSRGERCVIITSHKIFSESSFLIASMLASLHHRLQADSSCPSLSRQLGARWNLLAEEERAPYVQAAQRLKTQHQQSNPDYKYSPRKRKLVAQLHLRPEPHSSTSEDSLNSPRPVSNDTFRELFLASCAVQQKLTEVLLQATLPKLSPQERRDELAMPSTIQIPASCIEDPPALESSNVSPISDELWFSCGTDEEDAFSRSITSWLSDSQSASGLDHLHDFAELSSLHN